MSIKLNMFGIIFISSLLLYILLASFGWKAFENVEYSELLIPVILVQIIIGFLNGTKSKETE